MSYPGVDPADTMTNPVAQQAVPAGNFHNMHDEALRGQISPEALKQAVAQAVQDQFAVTAAWKSKPRVEFVIECPSGQRCLAKHLNTMDLIDSDLIEEVDFFTKKLFPSALDSAGNPVDTVEDPTNDSFWSTLKDAEKKARFFRLLNRLLSIGIVKPKVVDDGVEVRVDESGSQIVTYGHLARPLKEGEVYASAIDFADKITIFGELNKPLDQIKPFREGSTAELPSVSTVEGIAGTP